MIKKINITLGVIAICGALFVGGMLLWTHLSSPADSKITQMIGR